MTLLQLDWEGDQATPRCSLGARSLSSSSASSRSTVGSLELESPRLLRLSTHARSAATLNQVRRLQLAGARERADGATVYALDVFLHAGQKGLPSPLCRPNGPPSAAQYRREVRYSELRALRERLRDVVSRGADPMHAKWCGYCSRVAWLLEFGGFPSRAPASAQGPVAACVGLKRLLVSHRRKHLQEFLARLLRTAKDASYRVDAGHAQCPNFARVSRLLLAFLAEPGSARKSSRAGSSW